MAENGRGYRGGFVYGTEGSLPRTQGLKEKNIAPPNTHLRGFI